MFACCMCIVGVVVEQTRTTITYLVFGDHFGLTGDVMCYVQLVMNKDLLEEALFIKIEIDGVGNVFCVIMALGRKRME